MRALVVVAHPLGTSLTRAVAAETAMGLQESGHSADIADLAAEGFDPRYTQSDAAAYLDPKLAPQDVLAERERVDRADALVLVYPVYWWSFPALLKGWIDRVFSNGWAYEEEPGSGVVRKRLQRLPVHLVAIGGADLRTYARHGYFGAMRTQIEHGIFDYCGARVISSELLLPPVDGDWAPRLADARAIGTRIFRAYAKEMAAA